MTNQSHYFVLITCNFVSLPGWEPWLLVPGRRVVAEWLMEGAQGEP